MPSVEEGLFLVGAEVRGAGAVGFRDWGLGFRISDLGVSTFALD